SFIQKNLIWAIPVTMILGLIYGSNADPSAFKSAIMPLTFLMVYPMMVNLQIDRVFTTQGLRVQGVTQFLNFGVIPFFAYGLGLWFFPNDEFVRLGLLLAALLPTSGMTISWTGFAKGDMTAAVKMTVIGLILGSVATPLYAKALMGSTIDIPLVGIFKQIALIVFLPMVMGYITQKFIIKKYGREAYQKRIKMKFPPISTIGVLGIVFVAMALKADSILSNPAQLGKYLVPLAILYTVNFAISTWVGKTFFNRGEAIALVYGTVMRNLSIALAIAMTAFDERGADIAVIIAMAYIIQVQAAAWYVKLTDRLFGPAPGARTESVQVEDRAARQRGVRGCSLDPWGCGE
ncbi:MAG: arsenic resistance protein, partial [Planctomycetes bacterium]|nr:arsenic resistance protein [Planctomycetota bacterium]